MLNAPAFQMSVYFMCTPFVYLYNVCAGLSYICILYAQAFHISVYLMCTPFVYL